MGRILIIPDSFGTSASGARVAQKVAQTLAERGHDVCVFSPDGGAPRAANVPASVGVLNWPQPKFGSLRQFIALDECRTFEAAVSSFNPEVVHFCSFGYHKPRFFIDIAKKHHARVVTQYFAYCSYCVTQNDCRGAGPCGKCQHGRNWNAIRYRCGTGLGSVVHSVGRRLLWSAQIPRIDAAFSTCRYMDGALVASGVNSRGIVRCPLPYDPSALTGVENELGSHFVFTGQFRPEKGTAILERIAEECPDLVFRFLFIVTPHRQSEFEAFRARVTPKLNSRSEISATVRWETGGCEAVRTARAVLLPSVWPTSTEYTLLEAMGLSKAVVAFKVGVHVDVLEHNTNALVYDVERPEDFVTGVRAIARDAAMARRIGQAGRRTFEALIDTERLYSALMCGYGLRG